MPTDHHQVRFDAESDLFLCLARDYLQAVESGDRLWRRIERAEDRGDFSQAKKLRRKLGNVEARIEAARAAITSHTRSTARCPMRQRSRPARLVRVARAGTVVA
jgi:hypothetical protein